MNHECRICHNQEGNSPFSAKEMMFGFRDEFIYFECGGCGCIQIADIPLNISKYYPENYYSYLNPSPSKDFIKRPYLLKPFTPRLVIKRLLNMLPGFRLIPGWIKRAQINQSHSILELGSGQGTKLLELRAMGYSDLTGADPFLPPNYSSPEGVVLLRKNLAELERSYDFVMLHHSLEHIPEQLETLIGIKRHLKPKGTVLIRIPLASSFAWKKYGPNWVQLDAPRHLYLHTSQSFSTLAQQAGFQIEDVHYDSTSFQFWGSEQYRQDIPLRDPRSVAENKHQSLFSRSEMREFDREARRLNNRGEGDQAAFYLRIAKQFSDH